MKHSLFRAMSALTVVASLAVPSLSQAAVRQVNLDQAYASLTTTSTPMRVEGTLDVQTTSRRVTKEGEAGTSQFKIHFSSRTIAPQGDNHDQEGRLVIDSVNINTQSGNAGIASLFSNMGFALTEPIAIQWKQIGKIIYVRLEKAPEGLVNMITGTSTDLGLVGQWIQIDLSPTTGFSATMSPTSLLQDTALAGKDLNVLKGVSILRLSYAEKAKKDANGHDIVRLHVRVNPTAIWKLQQAAYKNIDPLDSYAIRHADYLAINKDFAQLRNILARMNMIVFYDQTANAIQRMEVGGSYVQPLRGCTWNSNLRREVCRVTSTMTLRYLTGFSFLPDAGQAIEPAENAITTSDLINKLFPSSVDTTPVEPPMPTDVATSTLP